MYIEASYTPIYFNGILYEPTDFFGIIGDLFITELGNVVQAISTPHIEALRNSGAVVIRPKS